MSCEGQGPSMIRSVKVHSVGRSLVFQFGEALQTVRAGQFQLLLVLQSEDEVERCQVGEFSLESQGLLRGVEGRM